MAENLNNEVEVKLLEVAGRVKALRQDMGLSVEEIAEKMGLTPEEYVQYEEGKEDFSFTFCFKFANIAKVDIADILEGSSPSLTEYTVTRKGQGRPIVRRADSETKYLRLASRFRNKMCEPYRVILPYSEEALNPPYKLVTHAGQEMNIVVRGSLKVMLGDSFEDTVFLVLGIRLENRAESAKNFSDCLNEFRLIAVTMLEFFDDAIGVRHGGAASWI